MIGILTENNICQNVLLELLNSLPVEVYQKEQNYDAVILIDPLPKRLPLILSPIISIGISHPDQDMHIETPIYPDDLVQRITDFYDQIQKTITFENSEFIFRVSRRMLTLKKSHRTIVLTEKENQLLGCLAQAFPCSITKDELLQKVWSYQPGTETHTVESHIYALRQKTGLKEDALIQSTSNGYSLQAE